MTDEIEVLVEWWEEGSGDHAVVLGRGEDWQPESGNQWVTNIEVRPAED